MFTDADSLLAGENICECLLFYGEVFFGTASVFFSLKFESSCLRSCSELLRMISWVELLFRLMVFFL